MSEDSCSEVYVAAKLIEFLNKEIINVKKGVSLDRFLTKEEIGEVERVLGRGFAIEGICMYGDESGKIGDIALGSKEASDKMVCEIYMDNNYGIKSKRLYQSPF